MSDVRENALRVLERVEAASKRAGHKVSLVAASKMNDAARVREAFDAGVRAFGENRVQELEEKLELGAYEGAALHFIGHLQRNKVKNIVGKAALIESVDSTELLEMIGKRAALLNITQDVLLEVNIGQEETKSGVEPGKIPFLCEKAAEIPSVRVLGLMTIPPRTGDKRETAGYFAQMYKLFVDMSAKKYDNVVMSILSMGMSADFEEAIAAGANLVRVGSAIFGERHYC